MGFWDEFKNMDEKQLELVKEELAKKGSLKTLAAIEATLQNQ